MASLSGVKVQLTLTLDELEEIVALLNFAGEALDARGQEVPVVVQEITDLYFDNVGALEDALEDFEPE